MQSVGAKLDNQTHEKVRDKCNNHGCTISEYIRGLISKDLNGEVQPSGELATKLPQWVLDAKIPVESVSTELEEQ